MYFIIQKDYEFGEDGCYTELFHVTEDGTEIPVIEGDWYHDKIDERIEGFFEALDYLMIDYGWRHRVINRDKDEGAE
jgi:hypothetical protein